MIQRGTSLNCLIGFIFSLYHVSQSPFFLIVKQNVLLNETLIALFYLSDKTV